MDWAQDGNAWPHREASRFVQAGGLRWHVQQMGRGPALLLVHGTGASSHSWRDLMPRLAPHFNVLVPDLPGHAFSTPAPGHALSCPGMAEALHVLLKAVHFEPAVAVGHSAGAAVLARLALDGRLPAVHTLMALNGALLPLQGLLRAMSPAAKLLTRVPGLPRLVAARAGDRSAIERLIGNTGSNLGREGSALYARLWRDRAHVAGVLAMMARWNIDSLPGELPRLAARLLLLAGSADRAVAPAQADWVAARVPGAKVVPLPGLGHLAHEEDPAGVAELLIALAQPLANGTTPWSAEGAPCYPFALAGSGTPRGASPAGKRIAKDLQGEHPGDRALRSERALGPGV